MKKILILLPVVALMSACSSFRSNPSDTIPPGQQQAISEQKLTNDFKRQGIKISYSWSGKLESIEATGYAPVWGNSQNAAREAFRVAELEAKKTLNDFINRETITSSTSVLMISRNLEKARDNKSNKFTTNKSQDDSASITSDDEIDGGKNSNTEQNTAVRDDALNIASRVRTSISIRNQGILGGLYLVDSEVINGGKTVRVVYRWDEKHTQTRQQLRSLMSQ